MKSLLVLCALVVVAVSRPEDTYNPQYDNFNAHELADNVRLLKNYANCFLGKGPCTHEGSDFKKTIPEALQTRCAKCTPKQKELIRIVVKALEQKLPEHWNALVEKNDPTGQYRKSFKSFLDGSD